MTSYVPLINPHDCSQTSRLDFCSRPTVAAQSSLQRSLLHSRLQSRSTAGCDVVENSDGQLKCGGGAGGPPPAAGEEAVRSFYEEEEAATRAAAAAAAAQRAGEL